MKKIGIIGSGTWGCALASLLLSNGHEVCVWTRDEETAENLRKTRQLKTLPQALIPEKIEFTSIMKEAIAGKDVIVCALPSFAVRECFSKAVENIEENQIIVSVSKGIEDSTFLTMTEIIKEELGKVGKNNAVVALSGPTHAEEVALKLPTTIVSACEDLSVARAIKKVFNNDFFKVFGTVDRKGVELCGALKNIIAIAAGISDGLGYGDNAKAAIITRGMAEVSFLGSKMGCHERTFFGLAGIGDMIVTATSRHSRNNRFGNLVGLGVEPKEALKQIGMVVEGMNVLPVAMKMAEKYDVELPIINAVNEVIFNGKDPKEVQKKLLSIPATLEFRFQN